MLGKGERFIEINRQRNFPDRFEPADQLFQRMFLTQILGIDIGNPEEASQRINQAAEVLVQIGDDISAIARAISQGLTEKYATVFTSEHH